MKNVSLKRLLSLLLAAGIGLTSTIVCATGNGLPADVMVIGTPAKRPDPTNPGKMQLDSWLTTENPTANDVGRLGHYRFNLDTINPATQAKVTMPIVIDIAHATQVSSFTSISYFTYKMPVENTGAGGIPPLPSPDLFNGVLSKPNGVYYFNNYVNNVNGYNKSANPKNFAVPIPANIPASHILNNKNTGLDFLRHAGILEKSKGTPWNQDFTHLPSNTAIASLWSNNNLPSVTPNTAHQATTGVLVDPAANVAKSGVNAQGIPYFQAVGGAPQLATELWQVQKNAIIDLDSVLSNASRVVVFGSGFVDYTNFQALISGVHDIHANQGNNDFFSGTHPNTTHNNDNQAWQDGGLIVDYSKLIPCIPSAKNSCVGVQPQIEYLRAYFMAKFSSNQDVTNGSGESLPGPAKEEESLPPAATLSDTVVTINPNSQKLVGHFTSRQMQVELLDSSATWPGYDFLPAGATAPNIPLSGSGVSIYVQNGSYYTPATAGSPQSAYRITAPKFLRTYDDPALGVAKDKFVSVRNTSSLPVQVRIKVSGNALSQ